MNNCNDVATMRADGGGWHGQPNGMQQQQQWCQQFLHKVTGDSPIPSLSWVEFWIGSEPYRSSSSRSSPWVGTKPPPEDLVEARELIRKLQFVQIYIFSCVRWFFTTFGGIIYYPNRVTQTHSEVEWLYFRSSSRVILPRRINTDSPRALIWGQPIP